MKHKFLLFLIVLSTAGCSLDELRHEISPPSGRAFSVEEAKEFFEKDYVDRLTKSQGEDSRSIRFRGRLYSGDFTPLWDKAVYSKFDCVASYDVDILADRKVVAIRAKFGASGSRAESLDVYQKLVVRRNVNTGRMSAYVMSLIPDVGCDDRCIPERFRSRGKDNGGFSGIVVHATTDRGALVRVQEYRDGILKRGVYLPSGKGSYIDRCVKAREILDGIAFLSRRNVMTKSGEDYWGDDYDDWYDSIEDNEWWVGNFEEVGFGVYTDGDGHYYLDNDDDGIIDEETIAPGYIEDEEPEEPEEPDEPEIPIPDLDSYPEDDGYGDDDFPEDDLPPEDEDIDEEMVALGREGVEKIKEDLEDGKVSVYQYLNGALTGLGVGANSNGIITSAANFVREIASDHLFQAFGKSISAVGVVCGLGQTIIAVQDGEELSTGDWMNIVSTTLGIVSVFIPASFPIVAGAVGVTSGVIGIISSLLSYNIPPGLYIIETTNGSTIYLYINNIITV